MIPSCPICGAQEIFDREIPGAYKRYQLLSRVGVGFILLALAGVVLLAFVKEAFILIIISVIGAAIFLVISSKIKVAETYCKKCDWLKKR